MLRHDEVYTKVVLTTPPATTPIGEDLKVRTKKIIKAISIFQVTIRNHLIPIVREFKDDTHRLWQHFQRWFESKAVQQKLILLRKLFIFACLTRWLWTNTSTLLTSSEMNLLPLGIWSMSSTLFTTFLEVYCQARVPLFWPLHLNS